MDYEFYIDDPNTNDIADLYGGGNAWQSIEASINGGGPVIIPAGQHTLYWTVYANYDADPNMAGFLDNVVFTPTDTNPVSANITLNIYREQDPTFGDMFVAYPSFNSVTPAGVGTTTNTIHSPNGYFNTQADQGGGGSGSDILFSLGSVLNECTNGLWSLYINYGMPNQRLFQFSVCHQRPDHQPAFRRQAHRAHQWRHRLPVHRPHPVAGTTDYTTLNVSKQNIDGSAIRGCDPAGHRHQLDRRASSPARTSATSPMPPIISPAFHSPCPWTARIHRPPQVWSAQVDLNTTATSIFVVTAGASHVTLLSPKASGGNFQFSFLSQTGFTNTIQYRTNLAVGIWQTLDQYSR